MKIFVDTSAWCALADVADKQHTKAVDILGEINRQNNSLLTTDYIFDETLTLLRFKLGHSMAVKFGEYLLASKVCQILEVDRKLRQRTWDIFVKYSDKKFSFTDCASFAVMDELNIKCAFSFDRHFKQYGFSVLSN